MKKSWLTIRQALYMAVIATTLCTLTACLNSRLHASPSTEIIRDIAYGEHSRHRYDVYRPREAQQAPTLFLVHGGAWKAGDKQNATVIDNKVKYWVEQRGYILISVNYRLVPEVTPLDQLADITQALAHAQQRASDWGSDKQRYILMGHSAGAHLIGLLSARPKASYRAGITPWLGSVLLDTAALNVVEVMQHKHFRFYDQAFGKNPQQWPEMSPYHQLTDQAEPLLLICSRQRHQACASSEKFARLAHSKGVEASVYPVLLSHGDVNSELGKRPIYTRRVDDFISALLKTNS